MAKKKQQPWDQQDNEPNSAYAHFLVYRDLGPSRTLKVLYTIVNPPKEGKKQAKSGTISSESCAWKWVERASAWDAHNIAASSHKAVSAFLAAVHVAAKKALTTLERDDVGPDTWSQALEALDVLAKFIPPETVNLILTYSRDARVDESDSQSDVEVPQ